MPAALGDFCRPPGGHAIAWYRVRSSSRATGWSTITSSVRIAKTSSIKGAKQWYSYRFSRGLTQDFRFYDMLVKQPASQELGETKVPFAARNPEIETEKLIHFAIGIFFKGTAHSWKGNSTEPWIDFGPSTEPLRKFVLGETLFRSGCF